MDINAIKYVFFFILSENSTNHYATFDNAVFNIESLSILSVI